MSEEINKLIEEVKNLRKDTLSMKISMAYDDFSDTAKLRKNRRQISRLLTKINLLKAKQSNVSVSENNKLTP